VLTYVLLNVCKIQLLPERLVDAIKRCKEENKSYDECLLYLGNADQAHRDQGLCTLSVKVRAVATKEKEPIKDRRTNQQYDQALLELQ
jgi:hypothetical protein